MFLLFSTCLLSLFLYYRKSFSETVKEKLNDFKELYLVQKQYEKNSLKCFRDTVQIVFKIYIFKLLQMENPIQKYDNKNIVLTYIYNDNIYKILIRTLKGPPLIERVINEKGIDISKEINPYLGPNYDFHQRKFTPSFWGQNQLIFYYSNSVVKSFESDEVISLF